MKQKELLILSIVVFLTIVSWLVIDIWQITKTKDSTFMGEIAMPSEIKMKIDASVFQKLKDKE